MKLLRLLAAVFALNLAAVGCIDMPTAPAECGEGECYGELGTDN